MSGIVYLSPVQMLCTTTPFSEFYGSATCLPVVLTGMPLASGIAQVFAAQSLFCEQHTTTSE